MFSVLFNHLPRVVEVTAGAVAQDKKKEFQGVGEESQKYQQGTSWFIPKHAQNIFFSIAVVP